MLARAKTKWNWLLLAVIAVVALVFAWRVDAMPQPNMEAALGHLEAAKLALERAEHNKGGFRVRAIERVNEAIGVVREGIAVGNR